MKTFADVDSCLDSLSKKYSIVGHVSCDYPDIESARVNLYQSLQQVWKSCYQDQERIILTVSGDFYVKDCEYGQLLCLLQTIVNDLDISNFFICLVSTNPNLKQEYQRVLDTVSTDSVPMECHVCSGPWHKSNLSTRPFLGKLQSLKNVTAGGRLSDPGFCMLPWIGIYAATDSQAKPCCCFDRNESMGDLRSQSISQIWNSPQWRAVRKSMLQGQQLQACRVCRDRENQGNDSLRQSVNRAFAHHSDIVDQTLDDGTSLVFSLKYWDVRYNNLCNLACRMCNPKSSTSWYSVHNSIRPESMIIQPVLSAGVDDQIHHSMIDHIDHVEKIYFAGGEPTMIEKFYEILDLLDEKQRHDVALVYNTNLTRLGLPGRFLPDTWKKFQNVSIGASLDASYQRAEYLRSNSDWSTVVKNRQTLLKSCPHVDFYISATVGLINALHLPDFHREWTELGLISPEDFSLQILTDPDWMSIARAPMALKQKIIEKYQKHLEWLQPLDPLGRATSGYQSVIDLCQSLDSYDRLLFWAECEKLDLYHGTKLLETFPELMDSGL